LPQLAALQRIYVGLMPALPAAISCFLASFYSLISKIEIEKISRPTKHKLTLCAFVASVTLTKLQIDLASSKVISAGTPQQFRRQFSSLWLA